MIETGGMRCRGAGRGIEEGLSYEIYTRSVEPNARPIIIQPDGDLTINYLDTHGLPLTAEHLASAMALVAKIARSAI